MRSGTPKHVICLSRNAYRYKLIETTFATTALITSRAAGRANLGCGGQAGSADPPLVQSIGR